MARGRVENLRSAGAPVADGQGRTYWIDEPRQLRCMISPRRHDIVDRLAAAGAMAIKDLADALGAQPSALYHHVQQLLAAGLVVESGYRVVNRRRERLYATPAPRMRFYRALQERRNAPTFRRIVASMARQMARDFRHGIASSRALTAGPARNLGMARLVAYPDRVTLARINSLLEEVTELLWRSPAEGAGPMVFAWTMAPLQHEAAGTGASGGEVVGAARRGRRAARAPARRRTSS